MGSEIKISVVVPTYNSGKFITKTLGTVYAQTVLPYEVLVIDDGSTDGTLDVVRKYVDGHRDRFGNVRIYEQKNKGAGAARNVGIRKASGNWISFLDSDDLWHPRKLELVEKAIRSHPDVSVIAHDEYSVREGNPRKKILCPMHENYDETENLFVQLYKGNLFSTSCMTVKKELLKKAGGFDVSLRSAQDYDLWIRVGMHGKLYYMDKPLETYVMREGNITSKTYRRYRCEMRICRKYIPQLKEIRTIKNVKWTVRKRIFMIHKVETYMALCRGRIFEAAAIFIRLPIELIRKI